jgi:LmbE family N-acetylglucosaminyl deacetylase
MRVLAIHAHPDDEVLFTGSTLAAFHAAGTETLLLTATLGEAAELGGRDPSPAALEEAARRREAKLRVSCALLGVSRYEPLGGTGRWRDLGRGPIADPGLVSTLTNGDVAQVSAAVKETVERLRPALVLTVGSDGATGHPDHVRIHDAVRAARPRRFLGACFVAGTSRRRAGYSRTWCLVSVSAPAEWSARIVPSFRSRPIPGPSRRSGGRLTRIRLVWGRSLCRSC